MDSLLESVILEHQIKCKCKEKDPIKHLKGGTQIRADAEEYVDDNEKLDPVGSTVRYEMMKLCTGSV